MADGTPFQEAIAHLRQKTNLPTEFWDSLRGEAHAKAFTVAGATKAALLEDLRGAVQGALEQGESFGAFKRRFDDIVSRHGWSHRGQPGWRARVIYDTNLRTAHAAGRWKQYQRQARRRPYLQYLTVGDTRVREEHRPWDQLVLPIDSPFWDTHFPPNGWGCRCTTRSLSERQLEREGLQVGEPPAIERKERVNERTGEIYGQVPVGIDVGWDYNVGKAWMRHDPNGGLPDCDTAEFARSATRCLTRRKGRGTWSDLGRPSAREIPDEMFQTAELLPQAKTADEALDVISAAVGLEGRRTRRLNTPAGRVVLHRELLTHVASYPERSRFANLIVPTLVDPYEVWLNPYADGSTRRRYIALFTDTKRRGWNVVIRLNPDGSLFWTAFPTRIKDLNAAREGDLIYGKE